MSLQGRPPKSDALKRLQGTFKPDRARAEVQSQIAANSPPDWLTASQKRLWRGKAAPLIAQGTLAETDKDGLGRYAVLLEQFISISGNGDDSDARKELRQLSVQLNKLESLYGLNPVSRERAEVVAPPREGGDLDTDRAFWRSLARDKSHMQHPRRD